MKHLSRPTYLRFLKFFQEKQYVQLEKKGLSGCSHDTDFNLKLKTLYVFCLVIYMITGPENANLGANGCSFLTIPLSYLCKLQEQFCENTDVMHVYSMFYICSTVHRYAGAQFFFTKGHRQ